MSLAQHIPNLPTVVLQSDWNTAAHVLADIEAAWGIDFGDTYTFSIDAWEGPEDPDDFAAYSVNAGVLTVVTPFATQPVAGQTVYILDIYFA